MSFFFLSFVSFFVVGWGGGGVVCFALLHFTLPYPALPCPTLPLLSSTSSHLIPSHLISSHPISSHPIPSHLIPSHPLSHIPPPPLFRGKHLTNSPHSNPSDYDLFLSPLSDFKKAMEEAGLGAKVVYLDRGDAYRFRVKEGDEE